MLRGRDPTLTLPPMLAPMMSRPMMMDLKREVFQPLSQPPQGPFPCLAPLNNLSPAHSSSMALPSTPLASGKPLVQQHQQLGTALGDDIVTLFPRRKAGQNRPGGGRGPVVLTLELLEQFYGMPLHVAAKRLGICQTAIKKVCRRLGVKKWPYKEMRAPGGEGKAGEGSEDSGSEDGSADSAAAKEEAAAAGSHPAQPSSASSASSKTKPRGADAEVHAAVTALLSLHAEAAS